MKTAVGILTHNQFATGRHEAFLTTARSLAAQHPDALYVVDNGSTDETPEYVRSLGGVVLDDPISTCGHGMNATIGLCAASGAALVVFSNDDICWHPGALERLVAFWSEAPDDVKIASGLLEDDFYWNTVVERIECGGVEGLVRKTAPGGAWTLRAKDWPKIGPVPEAKGWDDVPTCARVISRGGRVVQLELADHIGEDLSTWGNDSAKFRRPLDREAWGLAPAVTMQA